MGLLHLGLRSTEPMTGGDAMHGYDTEILPGGIGEIAGASMLGDIGACDGDLHFDPPTPEDLYVAAVSLASELMREEPTRTHRKIERAALWLARAACEARDGGEVNRDEKAHAEGRRVGLEEAAKSMDNAECLGCDSHGHSAGCPLDEPGDVIRALMDPAT